MLKELKQFDRYLRDVRKGICSRILVDNLDNFSKVMLKECSSEVNYDLDYSTFHGIRIVEKKWVSQGFVVLVDKQGNAINMVKYSK